MPSDNLIASTVLALLLMAAPAGLAAAETAEDAIRATFAQWTKDFNAGNAEAVCQLFSPELRYDFRGYPERDYNDVCTLLHRSLSELEQALHLQPRYPRDHCFRRSRRRALGLDADRDTAHRADCEVGGTGHGHSA